MLESLNNSNCVMHIFVLSTLLRNASKMLAWPNVCERKWGEHTLSFFFDSSLPKRTVRLCRVFLCSFCSSSKLTVKTSMLDETFKEFSASPETSFHFSGASFAFLAVFFLGNNCSAFQSRGSFLIFPPTTFLLPFHVGFFMLFNFFLASRSILHLRSLHEEWDFVWVVFHSLFTRRQVESSFRREMKRAEGGNEFRSVLN